MIPLGILQNAMSTKPRSGQVRIVRPCDPDWCKMPKGALFEVMAIVAEHCRKKDCKAEDLCVAAHLCGDKLRMVKVYNKTRKPEKGWRRIAAAWRVLLKGTI